MLAYTHSEHRTVRSSGAAAARVDTFFGVVGTKSHVILFLGATRSGPQTNDDRRFEMECAAIADSLKKAMYPRDFSFKNHQCQDVDDFMRHLTAVNPTIIHLSCLSSSSGLTIDTDSVTPDALAQMVRTTASNARLVVLSASHSKGHAEAMCRHIDFTVGMDGAIGHDTATSFATRFYGALGDRRSIANAHAQGIAMLAGKKLRIDAPLLVTRKGIDPHNTFFHPNSVLPARLSTDNGISIAASDSVLKLDRYHHRSALDDMLQLSHRVNMLLVHGEDDQGHDHFKRVVTHRLSGDSWEDLEVPWPPQLPSLGNRLAMLFEGLAKKLLDEKFLGKSPILDGDPTTIDGKQAWAPVLAQLRKKINISNTKLLVRHTVESPSTGGSGDAKLIKAYLTDIWESVAPQAGKPIIVGFNLKRSRLNGWFLSSARRRARAQLAATATVAAALRRFHVPERAACTQLPELTSVTRKDLAAWLHHECSRPPDAAEQEAKEIVALTHGGRFDHVVRFLKHWASTIRGISHE